MNGVEVLDIGREALYILLIVSAPVMIVSLVVGLVIALFQALTQIQEMTLTFVPKIAAIFITLMIFLPFMGATIGDFYQDLMDKMATPQSDDDVADNDG